MIYIIISILCSITVGVLFKLAKRYKINVQQAITWNYLTAIILSFFFFKPEVSHLKLPDSPTYYYLGILLPCIFWILSMSIKNIGIARTDIAQRLSLIIPLIAAYFLFQEAFSSLKVAGLGLAFLAIVLMLSNKNDAKKKTTFIYPLLVFIGFGTVDILFKQLATNALVPYTTSLLFVFCIAFVISTLAAIYLLIFKKQKLELINLLCGLVLGIFNFCNILFYLKAHKALSDSPSVVFAAMNIGVVVVGTLVGYYIFKERLSKLNFIGVGLAIVAITLITIAQFYAH
jgi:drug/metabolite transporter (DMT)-like permease